MIKHIVLFKLNTTLTPQQKERVATAFKRHILTLCAALSYVKDVEVGLNINPNEQWDIALIASFENMADLQSYASHPDHIKAAAKLRPHIIERSCVDFDSNGLPLPQLS